LYSRSQYDRLDDQLRSSVPIVEGQLDQRAEASGSSDFGPSGGFGYPNSNSARPGPNGRPSPPVVIPNIWAELRDSNGATIENATLRPSDSDAQPDIPSPLPANQIFTTGSSDGSGDWRVLVSPVDRPHGATAVIAVPLTEVSSSLDRLV